jgi:predicted acetyltransferase
VRVILAKINSKHRDSIYLMSKQSWSKNHPAPAFIKNDSSRDTIYYLCLDGKNVVGWFQIRRYGSAAPGRLKTHLYYEVIPSCRGRGFGGKIFCIAKFLSYIFVPSRLLISCRPNSTSEKIIQSQGGLKIDNKAGMNYYIINHIENI